MDHNWECHGVDDVFDRNLYTKELFEVVSNEEYVHSQEGE